MPDQPGVSASGKVHTMTTRSTNRTPGVDDLAQGNNAEAQENQGTEQASGGQTETITPPPFSPLTIPGDNLNSTEMFPTMQLAATEAVNRTTR